MTPAERYRRPAAPPSERELAEDRAWRQYTEESLARAQSSAEQWRTGLGLLVTVMAAGLMLGGPGRMADLRPEWRGVLTAGLGIGFVVALCGLWAASRAAAAGGSGPADRDRVRAAHGGLAAYKAAVAARGWRDIRRARTALLVSVPLIVTMTLTSWWLPRASPAPGDGPNPRVLVVTPGAVRCGELTGTGAVLTVRPAGGSGAPQRIPVTRIRSLTVVQSCPP
ncbi:hypothetical protein [Streptomyces zhihengii]|uniref:hypothetical protein n=1 Tax=Streptomyces zhihengii TaxID=1818004 RepID=UPI00362944EA